MDNDKLLRIEKREQRELKRLYKENKRGTYPGYFIILIVILIFGHAIDEICSNVNNDVQSSVVNEFFKAVIESNGYPAALSQYSIITLAFSLFVLVAPFYRSLSDILGRKTFLVLNVIGMFAGLGLTFWSPNLIVYCIGLALINFFILHDMQVVYIFEVAPKKSRATFYGFTKCIGTLSVLIIPLCRNYFMGGDTTKWRLVYLVPMIIAAFVALLLFIFARETKPFLDERIAYLEKPYELRVKEKEGKR